MKKTLLTIAGIILAGAVLAQVDPTRPMMTGRGNVAARPQKAITTNQTATNSKDQPLVLEKLVVTGSLIPMPAK